MLVSIGPLLSRNGQSQQLIVPKAVTRCFNWATSQQKWIAHIRIRAIRNLPVSIGPLLSRNGQPSPQMYQMRCSTDVSIGPLLSRNGQRKPRTASYLFVAMFQLGHFLAEMDRNSWNSFFRDSNRTFQLGHFLAEMDRSLSHGIPGLSAISFNWATSQQKWIARQDLKARGP